MHFLQDSFYKSDRRNWEREFKFQITCHTVTRVYSTSAAMHKQGRANNSNPFNPFPQRKRWFKFEVRTRNVQMLARVVNAQSKSHNLNQIDSVGLNHTKASGSKEKEKNNCNIFMLCSVMAMLSVCRLAPPTGYQSQPLGTKVSEM